MLKELSRRQLLKSGLLGFGIYLLRSSRGEFQRTAEDTSGKAYFGLAKLSGVKREVCVEIETGETLIGVAGLWERLGSSICLVKKTKEGKNSLVVTYFLPEKRDLGDNLEEYKTICGQAGKIYIQLFKLLPKTLSLFPPPAQIPFLQVNNSPEPDYKAMQIDALSLYYLAESITCPSAYEGYHHELSLGSQRLGECFNIMRGSAEGKRLSLSYKLNDAKFSAVYIFEELQKWGLISRETGQPV